MFKYSSQLIKRINMKFENAKLKTLKVSPSLHTAIKIRSVEAEMDLTTYVHLLLEFALLHPLEIQTLRHQLAATDTKRERLRHKGQ